MPKREKMLRGLPGKRGTADLARMVREARTGRGLTQEQLASEVGVSRSFIHEVECERAPITHEDTVKVMADALGYTTDQFYAAQGIIPPDIIRALQGMSSDDFSLMRRRLETRA